MKTLRVTTILAILQLTSMVAKGENIGLRATKNTNEKLYHDAKDSGDLRELQEDETFDCEFSSIAKDYYDSLPDHEAACTNIANGELLDLDFTGTRRQHLQTGSTGKITGRRVPSHAQGKADSIKVRSVGPVSPPGHGGDLPVDGRKLITHNPYLGTRTAMVLFVRFTDAIGTVVGMSDASRDTYANTINQTVFGVNSDHTSSSGRTFAGSWEECSYNKLSLDYDVDNKVNDLPGSTSDIFYADIPLQCTAGTGDCSRTYDTQNACGSNEYYGWPETAFNKLQRLDTSFDKNKWNHKIVIFDKTSSVNCNFIGMGNTGCSSSYCYSWIPHTYAHQVQDYTHELGHNINLAHAGLHSSTGATGNSAEYGDYSDAMGFCCSIRCYGGPHAYELGWLTPSLNLDDSNFGSGTFLTNVQLDSMSLSDQGAITITGSWAGGAKYWLQYKTAHTYDKYMNSNWLNNVQIIEWSDTATYERSDNMKVFLNNAGDSWNIGDVTVKLVSLDGTKALVDISHGATCASSADCAICQECIGGSCQSVADNTPCSDSDFCNGEEVCVSGACTAGSNPCPLQCDEDSDQCVECLWNADCSGQCNVCSVNGSCVAAIDGESCDNGSFCDGVDVCNAGVCESSNTDPCPGQMCNESNDECVECLSNNDCTNGTFCNGEEICSGGVCISGTSPCPGQICEETGQQCVECLQSTDCGNCEACNTSNNMCEQAENCCGNGVCESNEDCNSCSQDCISRDATAVVTCNNDGVCEKGEDHNNCPNDCRGRTSGRKRDRFICVGGQGGCLDTRCNTNGWKCLSESYCCGDSICSGPFETVSECSIDCN